MASEMEEYLQHVKKFQDAAMVLTDQLNAIHDGYHGAMEKSANIRKVLDDTDKSLRDMMNAMNKHLAEIVSKPTPDAWKSFP